MPSSSPKQARFMAAVAHGFKPTKEKGPPMAVAKEFNQADTGGMEPHEAEGRKAALDDLMGMGKHLATQRLRGKLQKPQPAAAPGPDKAALLEKLRHLRGGG